MHREENRLLSFRSGITDAVELQNAIQLARNGFYTIDGGYAAERECNWCNQNITQLLNEEVIIRHRRNCLFVEDPLHCGNIPSTVPAEQVLQSTDIAGTSDASNASSPPTFAAAEAVSSIASLDLKNESVRLETFKNWPNSNVTPQSLAKAGFYYINYSDHVKCAWCKGIIAKWEEGDNAFVEHQRFFPSCPLVQLGPLIEIAHDGIQNLGIQQICPPRKAKFSSLDARMRTYSNWPILEVQRPEILAQAGFYYQNQNDHVRCFHCNGGLRSWQKEDDPWFEHAKWFPYCQFVKLVKGPIYVAQVQETGSQPGHESNIREAFTVTQMEQVISLDDAMLTDPVRRALEMGLNEGRIRNATRQQLESCGKPFESTEELVEAVLEGQADEEYEDDTGEQSSSIVREVSRILNTIFSPRSTDDAEGGYDVVNTMITNDDDNNCTTTVPEPTTITNNIPTHSTLNPNCDMQLNRSTQPVAASMDSSTSVASASADSVNAVPSTSASMDDKTMSLEEENRQLKDARLCKVCMDDEVGVVFLPCGHLVTCVQCAPGVNQCPLCRSTIKGFVRTFLS